MWNARADTSRLPSGPWMIMEPFSAANAADRSSDGSAWQSDPPMVPQFLTIGSAITRSASCRIAKCSPASVRRQQVRVPGERADAQLAAGLARCSAAR